MDNAGTDYQYVYIEDSFTGSLDKLSTGKGSNVWVNCAEEAIENCLQCDLGCLSCSGTSDNCQSCDIKNGYYLAGSSCLVCDVKGYEFHEGGTCLYTMQFENENWYLVRRNA
jgi:hypothetical protein